MEKEFIDSKEIMEDIDTFEDYVERLYLSNKITYDEKYHKEVIKKYRNVVNEIKKSSLSNEDKGFMMETLTELFNEYSFLNVTIDK